jgi:hypothetical protein
VRQILLKGVYNWQQEEGSHYGELADRMEEGSLSANQLLATYCSNLYTRLGTYEAVATLTKLDRRTVKKYIVQSVADSPP